MNDKLIGIVAIAVLTIFLGILVWFVPSIDLIVILVAVLGVAGVDYYLSAFKNANGDK